ncbi:exonuclease domain-containing protein [Candidatus Carsonella ruddii]|uniref:DNA polymerase III subunit epsilon n=1 Tax=Candidatus Carsonella ruddii PC isolate NHV TaxID=1202540 RepID=J3Z227_CARRU|nr:exonuclease domain-containing protein [Candidatus Carsonella ruddii]AFP84314.1 DNA polymerase III epsilon subunit [Candidatus Carsonella ruddii PC isolate NHV]
MKRIIFLDVETTGLFVEHGDRIIELGCVEVINGFITGRVFHSFFNPGIKISKGAFNIHGIKNDFLISKPMFYEKINEFLGFINNSTIIAHNAKFDISFINKEISLTNLKMKKIQNYNTILDSLLLFRKLYPRKKNNLNDLCLKFNIIKNKKRKHRGLDDAFLLAILIIKTGLIEKIFQIEI